MSSQGDNNHYMLYHFLLIFPTGFKGVLATYQILLSSYFSHWVFGARDSEDIKIKDIIKSYKYTHKIIQEDSEDYTRDFQEMTLSKGEC